MVSIFIAGNILLFQGGKKKAEWFNYEYLGLRMIKLLGVKVMKKVNSKEKDHNLQNMSPEELGKLFPIVIAEPSADWAYLFQVEKEVILKALPSKGIVCIDHIGSTAIPGMKAKPTIDILLQVTPQTDNQKIIDTFKKMGYHYTEQPDNPPPHMMFVKGYTIRGLKGQAYHIHVRYSGDWDELYFRDYLLKYKEVAKEYEKLKIKLAKEFRNDREGYTKAKTDFVEGVNEIARKKS